MICETRSFSPSAGQALDELTSILGIGSDLSVSAQWFLRRLEQHVRAHASPTRHGIPARTRGIAAVIALSDVVEALRLLIS